MSQSLAVSPALIFRWLPLMALPTAFTGLIATPIGVDSDRVHLTFLEGFVAIVAMAAGGVLAYWSCPTPRRRSSAVLLYCLLAACAVIAARTASYPAALLVSAFVAGGAVGAFLRWLVCTGPAGGSATPPEPSHPAFTFAGLPGSLLGLFVLPDLPAAVHAAVVCAALVFLISIMRPRRHWGQWWWALPWIALALLSLGWVGATNPRVSWLGPVTSHGPRDGSQVALTFDDGPNGEATLAIMQALDARGVKGTFFLVGKAVDREPEVAQRIIADGHLVGNHSYAHDGWRFIQPGYPELARGERAIRAATGVCPQGANTRFYRPPHGTHTPFVWLAARHRGMRVVTWDVSAQDWIATDAAALARRIVERARPGSIILLHDGIDGLAAVDRSVLIAALPAIIDGLRAKGLEPVRLDALLNERGLVDGCT